MRVSLVGVVSGVFCLLFGLTMIWFLKNFDSVTVERTSGFSREARANDYLAAQMVLDALGVETDATQHFRSLPPVDTTLIMPVSRRQLPDSEAARQKRWVDDGGHLVVWAQVDDDEYWKDPLLENLEVWAIEAIEDEKVIAHFSGAEQTTTAMTVSLDTPAQLQFDPDVWQVLLESETAVYAVSRAVGRGRLTILAEPRFFSNHRIAEADHAGVLWSIVRAHPHDRVLFVITESVRSLWQRIYEDAWMVLLAGAALITTLVWANVRRFGPVLPEPSIRRRRLLDHIQASGRFLWRHKQATEMVETVRTSLLRTLEFRHPGWSNSSALYERLADIAELPPEVVRNAFAEADLDNEQVFTQTIATLETIRKKL